MLFFSKDKDTQTVWQPFDMFQTPTSKIFLLIFLYILQGVPLGLGASLPYLLQARKVCGVAGMLSYLRGF